MAAIDFPAAPAPGDEHTQNGITYTWTGSAWVINHFPALPLPAPKMQQLRTSTNNNPPTGLLPGQLAIEMGVPLRLWVGVPVGLDPSGKKLLTDSGLDPYVNVTGDTMTGDLHIAKATPTLFLDKTGAGQGSTIEGTLAGVRRWVERLGDDAAESGGNAGSDYILQGYTDAGAALVSPILRGKRSDNRLLVAGPPTDPLGIATKAYVDAVAAASTVPPEVQAFANLFINGDFGVAQEYGTGVRAIAALATQYICDLFTVSNSANVGTLNASQVNTGSTNPGFNYSMKFTVTTAYTFAIGTDVMMWLHYFEGARWQRLVWGGGAAAKAVTISFWIKSTIAGTASLCIRNAASTRTFVTDIAVAGGGIWEYKQVTIPGCPDGVWPSDHLLGASFIFTLGAGATGRIAPGAWTASGSFISNNQTNFLGTIGNVVEFQGFTMFPGSVGPTAAQSILASRVNPMMETILVQRYVRPHKWSLEGYCSAANTRVTTSSAVPTMRAPPSGTRQTTGSFANIRGSDPATFVTCGGADASTIATAIEAAAAGYTQANGFVDILSSRF